MINILIYLKFVKQANKYIKIYYHNIIHYHFVLYDMNIKNILINNCPFAYYVF